MKRFPALFLALALLLSAAALPSLAEDAPVTITVSGPDSTNSRWTETLAVQYLEKMSNTRWDVKLYPADIWPTKLTLLLTSNELPDVCFKANADKSAMNLYGKEGYLLDLTQYLDSMPNFKAALERYPDYRTYHTTEDGAIYSLANLSVFEAQRTQALVYINRDWLENVNMEVPQTVEELYTVLKAFKEQDANGNGDPNDEIPLSFDTYAGQRVMNLLQAGFGVYSTATDLMLGVDEAGKVFLYETTENFKNYLKFMRTLYAEKLMDDTCFIQTYSERREKAISNRVGMFSDWSGLLAGTCGKNAPEAYDNWAMMYGLGSEDTPVAYPGGPLVNPGAQIFVNADTKYPQEICKVIDTLFTDEYILMYNCGVEGDTFDYVTTGTGFRIPAVKKSAWEDKYDSEGVFRDQYLNVTQLMTKMHGMYYTVAAQASQEELETMKKDEILTNYAYREELVRTGHMVDTYPVFAYNKKEAEVQTRCKTDLITYLQTMRVAFITGEANIDADWDSYQASIQAMGLNDLLAVEQSAYDRYAVNLK